MQNSFRQAAEKKHSIAVASKTELKLENTTLKFYRELALIFLGRESFLVMTCHSLVIFWQPITKITHRRIHLVSIADSLISTL
jgi:hypothetical protein